MAWGTATAKVGPDTNWETILPSEHLYYFNRDSLARLLEKHGLKIIRQRFSLQPGLKIYATHAGVL